MSKIEKALNRARDASGNVLWLPAKVGDPAPAAAAGTALVPDRQAHPETISRMAASETRLRTPDELQRLGLICRERVHDPVVRVFRELRTKIVQQSQGRGCTVLVTGVSEDGGTSFVAQNLGAAFAFDAGKTALLVDCNLKDPSVHRLVIDWAGGLGLMDFLDDPKLDLTDIIYPVGIARYRAIPAGLPRDMPAEYFTSLRMRNLLDSVSNRYMERFVVIDGPQMDDLADVRILSELCDYVVIVARYGCVTGSQIESCVRAVSERKLLGVVFNDEPNIPKLA